MNIEMQVVSLCHLIMNGEFRLVSSILMVGTTGRFEPNQAGISFTGIK